MKKIRMIAIMMLGFFLVGCGEKCSDPSRYHNGEKFRYSKEYRSDKHNACIQTFDDFEYSVSNPLYFQTREIEGGDFWGTWDVEYEILTKSLLYRKTIFKDDKKIEDRNQIKENCDSDCYRKTMKEFKLEYLKSINETVGEDVVKVIR